MSTQANVVLRFLVSGQNSVSGVIDKLTLKKKELTKPATIPIDAEDNATVTIDKVRAEADALNKKRAEIPIGTNSSKFKADMLAIDMRLAKLNKYLAAPDVELQGLDRTLLGIHRIGAAMDKLNGKTSRVNIKVSTSGGGGANKNVLSRLFGSSGGAFSGPFAGISGVGSGASAGVIEALTSPVGAGSALAALPFLGTGVAGGALGVLGSGLAGLGVLGAVGTGKTTPAQLKQAQQAVQQAALQVKAAQLRLSKAQAGTAGSAGTAGKAASPASITSARATLLAAQNALGKAKGSQVQVDQLRVQAAQQRLAQLLGGTPGRPGTAGKPGSPAAIASAQAALFAAQSRSQKAKDTLSGLQATAKTPGQQNLRDQFSKISKDARSSLATIGASFVPVMGTIVKVADSSLKKLTPAFASAEKTISGPFQKVGVILAQSFASPAVVTAVNSLAKSFGAFLVGFAPQIPGIVNALANGITGMATAFTDHPGMIKGMGSVLAFLLKIPGFVAAAMGSLTRVTSWLISGLPHAVSIGLDKAREFFINIGHTIETVWNHFWDEIKGNPVWDAIRIAIKIGWAAITLVFKSSMGVIVASWNIFWGVILNVAKVAWTLIKNAVKGIWDIIAAIFKVFIDLITFHWTAALNAMKNLGIQIWNLTKNSLSAIWNGIKSIAIAVWNSLKGYLIGLWNNIKGAASASWNAVKNSIVNVWHAVVATGKSIWSDFFGWLRSGWQGVVNSAKTIWNGIKAAVSTPVKWVVNNVWDRFAGIINTATNFLHLGKPLPIVHMAGGGKLPGYGGGDQIPALLEAGETVVDKKRSRMYSHLFKMMGVPGHASGGVIGGPTGGSGQSPSSLGRFGPIPGTASGKDILNVGKNLVQGAVLGVIKPVVNSVLGLLSHIPGGNTPFGKMITQLPKTVANDFFKWISGQDKKLAGSIHAVAAKSGSAAAAQAFARAHLAQFGWGQNQMPALIALWNQESGWNANAVNPSSGAYGIPQSLGHGHPYNLGDYANQVLWGLNYIKGRYGSPIAAWAHERAVNWYAKGTGGAAKGWAWVGEKGPELVHFNGGEQVVANHHIGGYAAGTAEINAGISLYLGYLHGDLKTIAQLQSEQKLFLKDISRYYSGHSAAWRESHVNRQTKAMEAAASKLAKIETNFKNAQSYASSVKSNISGYAALSNFSPNTVIGTAGSGIAQGLAGKLSTLKSFASAITKLRQKGVSAAIIRQIIDMGPDDGLPYARQLINASSGTVRKINSLESQVGSVASSVGRSAAFAVYGVDIVKGVASQEKPLKSLMKRLGETLGKEAAAWFHVPKGKVPKGYAAGTSNAARGWHLVGENGPEMLFFRGGEKVIPAGRTRGGDGASAPTIINVNVSPTPLARPADIGREVVAAIRQYEKGSGTSWRR